MGRTQTDLPDITEPPPLRFSGCAAYVSHAGHAGQKRHSKPGEGPRVAKMALPGRFTPTVRAHDFGGFVPVWLKFSCLRAFSVDWRPTSARGGERNSWSQL